MTLAGLVFKPYLRPKMFKSSLAVLAAAAASSQAHTIFQRVHVNGVDQGYLFGMRYPTVRNLAFRAELILTVSSV